MKPLFSGSEFESRHDRVRKAIAKQSLDAVVAFAPVNIFWTSGYIGSPSHRKTPEFIHAASYPWIIIPRSGEVMVVGNAGAIESYEKETTISRIVTHHPTADRPPTLIDALRKAGLAGSGQKIGFDLGDYESLSVPQYQFIQTKLKDTRIVDATSVFQLLRMIKSPREIEFLRIAADIQNRSFAKFFSAVRKGMNEVELTAMMERFQFECGSTESGNALVWTHPSYALFKKQYPDRLVKDGDVQWVDGGAVYNGYHADYDQLMVYGSANSKQRQTFDTMKKVYDEGITHFKVGESFRDISRKVLATMKKHGVSNPLDPEIFLGHNLGYEMVEPPYFGSFTSPDIALQPGMVIAPEWFTATEYGPILYERNFIVREDGLEEISEFEKELIEIGNK
jgi:Xaa-Pro aminopeptidase